MSDVIVYTSQQMGIITLNKPSTLNALDLAMVRSIRAFLEECQGDRNIQGILIQSQVQRVFSAGGDIKAVYHMYQDHNQTGLQQYIQEEYALNQAIHAYPKPVIAVMDGVTLGGGVGLSRYASCRIVTENARIGMPEIKIAFFPDVSAGYFLNQLELALSSFLALTGYIAQGLDLITTGYATTYVHRTRLPTLIEEIQTNGPSAVANIASDTPETLSELDRLQPIIHCFAHNTLEDCLDALGKCPAHDAKAIREQLLSVSPLALKIVWHYIRLTRGMTYAQVLEVDLHLAQKMFDGSDLFEGIRTRLIDKGTIPKWRYASLRDVDASTVASYFEHLDLA